MRVVGLLSGGKDSCYNLCHCVKQGHEVVALATLAPPEGKDELDSYMYQTVGHDAIHLVAQAMDLPLYRHVITGQPLQTGGSFGVGVETDDDAATAARDETQDLYDLLLTVKRAHPDIQAVSVGAILSNYQRVRVETICARPEINLQPLAFLWQRSQSELLAEMVQANVEAVLIKVAGIGLDERDLGKSLAQMQPKLTRLSARYGAHVCGEGGEYETLTLDCPLFKRRIQLEQTEVVVDESSSGVASVAYLRMSRAVLVEKSSAGATTLDDVVVPPVLDREGRATMLAAGANKEANGRVAVGQARRLPTAPVTVPPCPPHPQATAKGKWVAFQNITGTADSAATTLESEVTSAFATLKAVLSRHSLSLAHTQHINLYISSQSDFTRVNAIYKAHFGVEPPSRATVALPCMTRRVLLDGWAYDDESRYTSGDNDIDIETMSTPMPMPTPTPPSTPRQTVPGARHLLRQCLHVQGLSYWAAANIGPYSQAVMAASRVTIAGQIGLRPVDLSFSAGDEAMQFALSLQHARRVFRAVLDERGRVGKGWIEGGVCWLAKQGRGVDRVAAANACWSAAHGGDDDDDDDDGQESTHPWLHGDKITSPTPRLPMLYVQVAQDALPRGAVVEWQLTGHDGRRRGPSSEDDDDDGVEADAPSIGNDYTTTTTSRVRHQHITSRSGQSSHGIITINGGGGDDNNGDDFVASLTSRLETSLSVKVFVDVSRDSGDGGGRGEGKSDGDGDGNGDGDGKDDVKADINAAAAAAANANAHAHAQTTLSNATRWLDSKFNRRDIAVVPVLGLWTGSSSNGVGGDSSSSSSSSSSLERWVMAIQWHDVE